MTICLITKQFHKFKMNEIIQIYIFDYRFSILDNNKRSLEKSHVQNMRFISMLGDPRKSYKNWHI